MHPSLPFFKRECTEEKGYSLEPFDDFIMQMQMQIVIPIHALQRDLKVQRCPLCMLKYEIYRFPFSIIQILSNMIQNVSQLKIRTKLNLTLWCHLVLGLEDVYRVEVNVESVEIWRKNSPSSGVWWHKVRSHLGSIIFICWIK